MQPPNNLIGNTQIAIFKGKQIRKTIFHGEWWFVIVDVIETLTDSANPKQYLKNMLNRDSELAKGWVQIEHPLLINTTGGKQKINRANTEGIFRIIQSIPSPKAEPFKRWLAKVGYERVQEIENPELATKRTRMLYKIKGYSEDWIEKRMRGIAIREVRQSELRKKIAYVPQEPLLFHRSIRENIACYNEDINNTEIIRASKAAHAHEFIEKLPDGYDTIVGERVIKLSGGQKQRVAIARAILKKAPIMIFDEATSALDSESEQIIQRALPEIMGKQTAIIVAHRLSTIAGLDRIIVMHNGTVIEIGNHNELLNLGGRYYSLWQKQTTEFVIQPKERTEF